MESTIFWQLIDTSAKVSLGALLAAAMIWMFQWRMNHQTDQSGLSRRVELLEKIAADVGTVSHAFSKYSALITESIKYGERWPVSRKEELKTINSELVQEFNKLAHSEATLLMLGEKNMEKTLRIYGAKIAIFRKEAYVGRQDITIEDITKIKTEINQLRENFYDILSRKYDQLIEH
ncbi:energy transducer TonB [Sessilibacter corallicola]|nr:energy transducer TonB [Sessilibacter corallicola]MCE2029529.1 energy transducer TonB [Sessilibacter corallicola]